MNQANEKYYEYKQKLIELNNENKVFDKLRKDEELNRNFQFQIYLLLEIQKDDEQLKQMIEQLKQNNFTIHLFNEYLSEQQIYSLLESNHYKINKKILEQDLIDPLQELKQQLEEIKKMDEAKQQKQKYIDCFEKSKKSKWFKKIRSKALNTSFFLALFTKKKKQKFKSLMNETINNLNSEFNLMISSDKPDADFVNVFVEYVIIWSTKKALLYTLITLIILFFVVLVTILVIVY